MRPPSEHTHWLFAAGFLFLGVCVLTQTIVGDEVWNGSRWRRYLWPGFGFLMGLCMWPVVVFFTSSTIHMLAHAAWAQTMTLAGAAHLGLASGRLRSRYWKLTMPVAFLVSGAAFLIHEQHGWLYNRSSFVHHVCAWTLIVGALFPLLQTFRPRSALLKTGFALTFIVLATALFSSRDTAPIFGHLSPSAGISRP